MSSLADLLVKGLRSMDVAREPARYAEGAMLLQEIQQHDANGARLAARVERYLARRPDPTPPHDRSLADWAHEVLSDHPGPMHYKEIAGEIRGRGFRHTHQPKHGDAQLPDSVWSAMYADTRRRFTKVDRGVWDLTTRVSANAA